MEIRKRKGRVGVEINVCTRNFVHKMTADVIQAYSWIHIHCVKNVERP